MTNRALLIASQVLGLSGCEGDVELMRRLLEARGFACTSLLTGEATRAGILAAVDELVAATTENDAAVIYYSGHGARAKHVDWEARRAAGIPTFAQFIVPSDIEQSTEEDFRGLLAEELSTVQRRLTDRTPNVTTILDCCHSAYMARNAELVPKATTRAIPVAGAASRLRTLPPPPPATGTDTNSLAVRIVACHPEQSAFERDTEIGRHGILTESLAVILDELGDREVSWAVITDLVRRRASAAAEQRPEVEGPRQRIPFSLAEKSRPYALPVRVEAAGAFIDAAALLGVAVGDSYRLQRPDADDVLGTAVVERFEGHRAALSVTVGEGGQLPARVDAVPVSTALPRHAVRLDVTGEGREQLQNELGRSPRLRVADPHEPFLARVADATEGGLTVTDGTGSRLHGGTLPSGDVGVYRALEVLAKAARAEHLRSLPSGEGPARLDVGVTIDFAVHEPSGRRSVPRQGQLLFEGDRVSLTIRNESNTPVYLWAFDVGISNSVTLISNDAPSGFRLAYGGTPGDTRVLGGEQGLPLVWPGGIDRTRPRPESIVVVLADQPQDLSGLETGRSAGKGAISTLDAILDEYRLGTRDWASSGDASDLRYRVERVDFQLDPRPKPDLEEPPFAVVDVPELSLRVQPPAPAAPPPGRLAVRITEVGALAGSRFDGHPFRLDALVMTAIAGGVVAWPSTLHFPVFGNDVTVRPDDGTLFVGDVERFLDIALWSGTLEPGSGEDLVDLLARRVAAESLDGALGAARGCITLAGPAVAALGTVGPSATLVRIAATVLAEAGGEPRGEYRCSRLAFEQFGVGLTPPEGLRTLGDVRVAYEILEAPA